MQGRSAVWIAPTWYWEALAILIGEKVEKGQWAEVIGLPK